MALTLSIGRGLIRSAYDPTTLPTLAEILSKLKSDFVTQFGNLDLSTGSIVELDKLAGEPVEIQVNGHFLAKGEVVVIDENFGVRITEIATPAERAAHLA